MNYYAHSLERRAKVLFVDTWNNVGREKRVSRSNVGSDDEGMVERKCKIGRQHENTS